MSSRYARFLTAGLAGALAACSSNGAPSAAPGLGNVSSMILPSGEHVVRAGFHEIRFGGAVRHARAGRSWMDPAGKKKALLYGSSYDGGFINIYKQKGTRQQPIGQLTSGLISPQGLFVDKHHNLWVANTNAFNIVAFKRNATAPFLTLNDPDYYPIAVVVDRHGNRVCGKRARLERTARYRNLLEEGRYQSHRHGNDFRAPTRAGHRHRRRRQRLRLVYSDQAGRRPLRSFPPERRPDNRWESAARRSATSPSMRARTS